MQLSELAQLEPTIFQSINLQWQLPNNITLPALIDGYFRDHHIMLDNKNKNIQLIRDRHIPYFVENSLHCEKKLHWLFDSIDPNLLPFYFACSDASMICLNDSWSLLGWVNHFFKYPQLYNKEIALIHYDSHQDMASPLIGLNSQAQHYDLLLSKPFEISNLWDVFLGIGAGSIGISSYITLLTLMFKKVVVLHINQFSKEAFSYATKLAGVKDSIIAKNLPEYQRLRLQQRDREDNDCSSATLDYFQSPTLADLMDQIPDNAGIYLHYDMDYFNNLYNGSPSNFRTFPDISYPEQKNKIRHETQLLKPIEKNIMHTTVALSPGFFPSQYWDTSVQFMLDALAQLNIDTTWNYRYPSI